MKKLFYPKSIAIIGASSKQGKIGNILVNNLKGNKKYQLFAVNPQHKTISGLPSYRSVLDINKKVDLAIIAVPAQFVLQVVKECASRSHPIRNIVIISAGFSETGKEGIEREKKLKSIAKRNNLNIVGPNCLGIANVHYGLNATFANNQIPSGSVGLIAQSGALTTALFDLTKDQGLGFSLVSTLGNKAGINENDMIKFFADDPNTKLIALYLEDISDGFGFAKLLRNTTPRKPIIVIKAGSSEKARSAIQSHTGAMAGDSDVIKTALIDNGAVTCENFPQFLGILKLFSGYGKPRNSKLTIITNAGGPGVIATDFAEKQKNLSLYDFTKKEKRQLKRILPSESSVENPVDVLGDALEDRYEKVIKKCSNFKNIGSVVSIITPQSQTPVEKIARVIQQANKIHDLPIIPVIIGEDANKKATDILRKYGLASFKFPSDAIGSLSKYLDYVSTLRYNAEKNISGKEINANNILVNQKSEDRKVLLYNEAMNLAKKIKINVQPARIIASKKDLKEIKGNYPYVLKIDSPTILHKNTKNGVLLNLKDNRSLHQGYSKLSSAFKKERIIIQHQIEPGLELIIGLKKDPSFGHILMLGVGGIYTEALDMKVLWHLPTSKGKIIEKILNSPLALILEKKKVPISVIVDEAVKVAKMAIAYPFIKELDINPIMIYKNKKPLVVDIKIIID